MRRIGPILFVLLFLLLGGTHAAQASRLTLERPGDREFIRDTAGLLPPGQTRQLHQRCDTLLKDTNVPIFVVTVESMAAFGGADMTIDSFARTLFDAWGDSHPLEQKQNWTNGILLVIAVQDRAARIELGRAWAGTKDAAARRIMDEHLMPAFRAGDFASGIGAGVSALDKMARGEAVPARPVSMNAYLIWAGFAALAVFTAVSFFRRGTSGWAWIFWAALFVTIGVMLYHLSRYRGDNVTGWNSGGSSLGEDAGAGRGRGASGSFSGGGASGSW